jgi:exosortase
MIPTLAVFVPLAVAYATALLWCVDRWNAPTEYFAHCWLVPFVAAFLVWSRRAEWRARPRAVDPRGWLLLGPALLLHLAGAALMVDSWSAASLVLAVPGAAWLALGRERLRGQWPILWLVLFCVPLPMYVEGRLAFTLKEVAVTGGSWLANALGADVVRSGDLLQPRGLDGALYVAEACSGLRSLLAMLTLAYCQACFLGAARLRRRLALLALAPLLAIAANVLRIAALCLLARGFGVPFAEGDGHTVANAVEWTTLVGALLAIDALLFRRLADASARPVDATAAMPARRLLPHALAVWLAAAPLLALSLYRPVGGAAGRADRLPVEFAGYRLVPRTAEQEAQFQKNLPRWRELLGTPDFVWRRYEDGDGNPLWVVALFHDANWKSVHPPRICIEGSNMDILGDDVAAFPELGEGCTAGRIVARSRGDGWSYVTMSLYGTADWSSGDYWDFTLHHLPRALVRANMSGFLLRVEAAVQAGETADAAEARARRFLRALAPIAQEAVR